MPIRKIKAGGVNIALENFIGEDGILFYDSNTGQLRLSDGHTPGGLPVFSATTATTATVGLIKIGANLSISADGTLSAEDGNYTLPTASTSVLGGVRVDGSTILIVDGVISAALGAGETDPVFSASAAGSITNTDISNWNTAYGWNDHAVQGYITATVSNHLLPSADLTYDIGSTSSQWRSLYVGTSTIYLGGTALSVSGGNLTVDGSPVVGSGTISVLDEEDNETSNVTALAFIGATVTNPEPGLVQVEITGGGGTTSSLVNGAYTVALTTSGDLQLSSGLTISPIGNFVPVIGTVIQQNEDELLQVISKGLLGGMAIGWAEDPFEPSRVASLTFNSTAEQVHIVTGSYTGTVNTWAFDQNGVLTTPQGGALGPEGMGWPGFSNGSTELPVSIVNKNASGNYFADITLGSVDSRGEIYFSVWNTATFSVETLTLDGFGNLSVPGVIYNNDPVSYGQLLLAGDTGEAATYLALPSDAGSTTTNVRLGNLNGNIQLNAGNNNWTFNNGGDLELPRGGLITETVVINELWATTTTSLTLVPSGAANGTQRLEIYSTGGGEGNHIHITSGDQNQTDLFLGNDTQYVAVGAMGQMEVRARPGTDSPSPGTSAYAGSPVWIYAGDAGDNGGNQTDGALGGDILLQAGISSLGPVGLGGSVYLQSGSGLSGYGSIKLSTDNGSTYLEFDKDNNLKFPNGSTSTGASVYVPYATSSSYKITTEADIGGPPYIPFDFEVSASKIILPTGNGRIQSGSGGGIWGLDSTNKSFTFPNDSDIEYGTGSGALSTGSLRVRIDYGGEFSIYLNNPSKTWTFDNNGVLTTPGTIYGNGAQLILSTGISAPGSLIDLNGGTVTVNAYGEYFTFSDDGNLTFPSNGGIVFDSSATSTITGITNIVFADGSTQSTAYTGAGASTTATTLDITNTNGIDTTYYLTFVENRTTGQEVRADVDLTFNSWSNTLGVGQIQINATTSATSTTTGALTVAGGAGIRGNLYAGNIYSNGVQLTNSGGVALEETFETKTGVTGTTTHDCTTNRLFYVATLGANFTPNFTNLSLASGEATSVSIVVAQTSTARNITGVQIASTTTGVTLLWQGSASAPSGNASRTDVFTFSILCTATNAYTVLGMLTSFGGV